MLEIWMRGEELAQQARAASGVVEDEDVLGW